MMLGVVMAPVVRGDKGQDAGNKAEDVVGSLGLEECPVPAIV